MEQEQQQLDQSATPASRSSSPSAEIWPPEQIHFHSIGPLVVINSGLPLAGEDMQSCLSEPRNRDAKCHGYDGLIRVKILASWGKSLGEHTILKNETFFGGNLHNLCEMSLSKLS